MSREWRSPPGGGLSHHNNAEEDLVWNRLGLLDKILILAGLGTLGMFILMRCSGWRVY